MAPHYITIDGMLSGTGLRDSVAGGYLDPTRLGLSDRLVDRIKQWLVKYEDAHYSGFDNKNECLSLDREGLNIASEIQQMLPQSKVEYFSHAEQTKMAFPLSNL